MKTTHLILFCLVFLLGLLLSQDDNVSLNTGGFVFIFKSMVQNLIFFFNAAWLNAIFCTKGFDLRLGAFKVNKTKREVIYLIPLLNYPALYPLSTFSVDLPKTTQVLLYTGLYFIYLSHFLLDLCSFDTVHLQQQITKANKKKESNSYNNMSRYHAQPYIFTTKTISRRHIFKVASAVIVRHQNKKIR